ncbi:hypothetical protein [Teichococcus aestuarii]|uniref:hypothetical protein n=1 Tax=Teichococcus aestuarii TaxID=568898 RepID=UPI003613980D
MGQAVTARRALWDRFCEEHHIPERGVLLFALMPDSTAAVFPYGRDGRPMLQRSAAMEAMVIDTVEALLAATPGDAEGLLYVMHYLSAQDCVVPLYIGKAGRHGRAGTVVSANVMTIRSNAGRFARWGYNYAYHMGDLSAAALPNHAANKLQPKYVRWARRLFHEVPVAAPRPRVEVRFWCTAWGPRSANIWQEFGSCPLAFAEYLLIGVAGLLFPDELLNDEGVSRMVLGEGTCIIEQ